VTVAVPSNRGFRPDTADCAALREWETGSKTEPLRARPPVTPRQPKSAAARATASQRGDEERGKTPPRAKSLE